MTACPKLLPIPARKKIRKRHDASAVCVNGLNREIENFIGQTVFESEQIIASLRKRRAWIGVAAAHQTHHINRPKVRNHRQATVTLLWKEVASFTHFSTQIQVSNSQLYTIDAERILIAECGWNRPIRNPDSAIQISFAA